MAPAADREGYWGPPTSTLEWCEENYAVSYYIAEFWNTVSNLIFIVPPIYGAIQTYKDGLEKRYLAAYLCLTAVGLGSWCFHMTLKYEMQLLDELPMIYSCCVFVYCLYECFKYKNTVNYPLLFLLITYSFVVSIVYLNLKEPVFHQSTTREDASCCGSCDTVSCMVAYSHRPGLLPSYPAKFIHKDTFPETQAKGEVCLWNLAYSSCGTTQEALTETQAVTCDHLAWLNKEIQQFLWLKCQTYGSIQVPLLQKDISVFPGQHRAKSWHTREIMFSTALF
ncbi:alkaline ceramidase 3 isoform 1-T1 [Amazona ochrocephala]